jgi:selenium metabolism protein YedF
MKIIDMRGNPCPIPIVHAKKVLTEKDADGVIVVVDNVYAVQNLEKMVKGSGYGFSYTSDGDSVHTVTIEKIAGAAGFDAVPAIPAPDPAVPIAKNAGRGLVALITADRMGRGAEDLGRLLIKGFIFSLSQLDPPPSAIIFLNSGAYLTAGNANTVPDLKTLEEKGTGIYTCGTCANYYKLTESLAVGSIVDMMAITNLLAQAATVITL